GELGARGAVGQGSVAARRTEVLVLPHVTARADDAAGLQARIEAGIGDELPVDHDLLPLLGDGGVATRARAGGMWLGPNHLHELPRDARTHALRVQRGLPVAELHRVTGPTSLWLAPALAPREAGPQPAQGWRRSAPVTRRR